MSLLRMSLAGGGMVLAVLLLRVLTASRLPRRTFPILWDLVLLRLLVPFTLRSPTSAYAVVERQISPVFPAVSPPAAAPALSTSPLTPAVTASPASPFPVWPLVWGIGFAICAGYFAAVYLRCRREFRTALPVKQPWADAWLQAHPRLSLRQSDRTGTPLTYGILRPVILLPKSTGWGSPEALTYILTHELVHIRRFDNAVKLLLTAAACFHWFNPLVWCMYLLAGRDLELACDEAVVRLLGPACRSAYARTLIQMEEVRGPALYSGFSSNNLEKRILAIMKWKKTTLPAALAAVLLITGVVAAFATSPGSARLEPVPGTAFTEEEYAWLSSLRLDGYRQMTVAEFQSEVWTLTDFPEHLDLLERFSQDEALYQLRDSHETAAFLFYVLSPLQAERWQVRSFDGVITAEAGAGYQVSLEYSLTQTILDPSQVTVGAYEDARTEFIRQMQVFLESQPSEAMQNLSLMEPLVAAECQWLTENCGSEALKLEMEYVLYPVESAPGFDNGGEETRNWPNGTAEDYRSLLTLKTPDCQSISVREFNQRLLDWGNEDYERMERINTDASWNDFQVDLTREELAFVQWTTRLSGVENARMVQSYNTGRPEKDPWYSSVQLSKERPDGAWCSLWFQFPYHIADKDALTVGERDQCIRGFILAVQEFWDETDLSDFMAMTEADVARHIQELAKAHSTELLTISTDINQIQFEHVILPPD